MVDAVEKIKAIRELSDGIAKHIPGTSQWAQSLGDTIRSGASDAAKPLELTSEQVQYMSISVGISTGVIALWLMNNPEVIKTFLEQMGKVGANLIPDISVTGGTA